LEKEKRKETGGEKKKPSANNYEEKNKNFLSLAYFANTCITLLYVLKFCSFLPLPLLY